MANDDLTLLRDYARNNSEAAFAALVSRYINLVYSVALRSVRDPQLAGEIAQAVFTILARKAGSLGDKTVLSGWLCCTARYASANALTIQRRRQHREQEAFMQSQIESQNDGSRPSEAEAADTWNQIAPLLDEAMGRLGQKDHDALVLRFFENKNFAEVGAAIGAGEDAAKMRVSRALEKLRKFLGKRGVNSTTAILGGTISAHSVQAAPIGLAKTVSAVAIAKGATASTSTLTLIKGALKIMAWTKAKTAAVIGVAVILAAGTTTLAVKHHHQDEAEMPIPEKSWVFKGYATPEATLQSSFWAMSKGDLNALLECFTPEFKGRYLERDAKDKPVSEQAAMFTRAADTFGDYRIDRQEMMSEGKLLLHIQSTKVGNASVPMEKIAGEWKINGNLTSDNLNSGGH